MKKYAVYYIDEDDNKKHYLTPDYRSCSTDPKQAKIFDVPQYAWMHAASNEYEIETITDLEKFLNPDNNMNTLISTLLSLKERVHVPKGEALCVCCGTEYTKGENRPIAKDCPVCKGSYENVDEATAWTLLSGESLDQLSIEQLNHLLEVIQCSFSRAEVRAYLKIRIEKEK